MYDAGQTSAARLMIVTVLWFVAVGINQATGAEFFVSPDGDDAWADESKTKIGCEINFNRHFHQYTPPGPLEEIEAAPQANQNGNRRYADIARYREIMAIGVTLTPARRITA